MRKDEGELDLGSVDGLCVSSALDSSDNWTSESGACSVIEHCGQ